MFFANYAKNLPLDECADNDGHSMDSMCALTLPIPVIIAKLDASRDDRNEAA